MLDIIPLTSARKHTQFYISTNHQKNMEYWYHYHFTGDI